MSRTLPRCRRRLLELTKQERTLRCPLDCILAQKIDYIKDWMMKMKTKNLKRAIRIVLILLAALVILHTFVACGGLPASQIEGKETESEEIYVEHSATTSRYAASRESTKYHRLSCRYVDNILPNNLVYYSSEEAAQRAGKSPCSVCTP